MLIFKYNTLSSHANTQKIPLDLCGESVLISFSSQEDAAMHFIAGTVVWESNYGLESCSRRQDAATGTQTTTTSVLKTIAKTTTYNVMLLSSV